MKKILTIALALSASVASAQSVRVGLAYDAGGKFDKSFNQSAYEGSQRADELARKLIAGRLAAAALGGSDAAGIMRGPLAAQLEMLPAPLIEKPYFLILSHALVAARPQLAERIWRGVEQARNSAEYRRLELAAGAGH